jgi:hypothetical protein
MEHFSEINQACEQPSENNRIQDMFKILLEKMAENNQSLQINLQNLQINLEKKISETNQEVVAIKKQFMEFDSDFEFKVEQIIDNVTRVIDEKISSEVTRVELKVKDKFEQLAEEMEEKVNEMIPIVQIEDQDCLEENLKRQGERAAQLKSKSRDLQNELNEGLNKSQVREVALVQNESSGFQISLTQADQKATNGITRERTHAYKSICLFMKYAYNFITVIIDITVYERDRVINNYKMKRNKKYRRLEWCINVKEKDVGTRNLKK